MNLENGRYLRVNLLGLGPCLIKNNLAGRGLTKLRNTALNSIFYLNLTVSIQTAAAKKKNNHYFFKLPRKR
jgi:hypothetical protein